MSRKPTNVAIKQRHKPKPKRPSKYHDFISMPMFMDAIHEDDFMYMDDNLSRYIKKRRQCIGESRIEERLLEEALKGGGGRCLATLLNPPYNVKYRCIRNLFRAFDQEDMRKVEAILPKIPKRFTNLRYDDDDFSVPSLLLRPHDVVWGMEHARIINEMSRPKRRSCRSQPMAELCNLFFELLLSTPSVWPEVIHFRYLDSYDWFLLAPEESEWQAHVRKCIGFPQCLFQYKTSYSFTMWEGTSAPLFSLFKMWMAHRFQSSVGPTDVVSMDPPSLLVRCRIRIRNWLVTLQKSQRDCPNYLILVNRLPLPQKLRDFLLFKELWPSGRPTYYSSDADSSLDDLGPEGMELLGNWEDSSDSDDYY